jgi:hypothetical protein
MSKLSELMALIADYDAKKAISDAHEWRGFSMSNDPEGLRLGAESSMAWEARNTAAVAFIRSDEFGEMVKNDARYKWLRDKSEKTQCGFYLSVGEALKDIRFQPQTVDNSIDAAIDAQLSQPQGEG